MHTFSSNARNDGDEDDGACKENDLSVTPLSCNTPFFFFFVGKGGVCVRIFLRVATVPHLFTLGRSYDPVDTYTFLRTRGAVTI